MVQKSNTLIKLTFAPKVILIVEVVMLNVCCTVFFLDPSNIYAALFELVNVSERYMDFSLRLEHNLNFFQFISHRKEMQQIEG